MPGREPQYLARTRARRDSFTVPRAPPPITGCVSGQNGQMQSKREQIAEVEAFFAQRGFSISVNERDGSAIVPAFAPNLANRFWVDLISTRTGEVFAPNYGSGPTRTLAIIGTEQRWLVEQDGTIQSNGRSYGEMSQDRLRNGGNI